MKIDQELLEAFETGLDPLSLEASAVPATVLGYGEISTVFHIRGDSSIAYKRMPLFDSWATAERYRSQYHDYCRQLTVAGLSLPADDTAIVEMPGRPVVFYIAQEQLPEERFCHRLIHRLPDEELREMLGAVVAEIAKVWQFNRQQAPEMELAIDGQLSNWVWRPQGSGPALDYIDTSTPLMRLGGREQLDPELFLRSAPSFLRWIIRWLFLEDVLSRYYDPRQVYIDLAANLYKEQLPELVPLAVEVINQHLPTGLRPLDLKVVSKYYREDKLIWTLFLSFRRLDRWLKTVLLRRRYEFILPGRISR